MHSLAFNQPTNQKTVHWNEVITAVVRVILRRQFVRQTKIEDWQVIWTGLKRNWNVFFWQGGGGVGGGLV